MAGTYGIFTFGLSLFILYLLSTLFICLTIFILLKVQNYLFNTSFKLANKIVFKNQECDKFHIVLFYFIIGFILWFTFYLIFRYDIFQQLFVFSKSISKEKECVLLYFILFITLIFKLTNQFIQKDKYQNSKWSCFRLLTLSYPLFFYSFGFSVGTGTENILLLALNVFLFYFLFFALLPKLSHGTGSLTSQMVKLINNKNGFKDIVSLFVFILQDLTIPFFFGSLLVALLQLTGLLNVLFQYLKI